MKRDIIYSFRLEGDAVNLSLTELYSRYQQAKELGALPASNVEKTDYAGRY